MAPPADPVEFFRFKMAGTVVPHIVLCYILCFRFHPHLWGVFLAQRVSSVKNSAFWLFLGWNRGVINAGAFGQNEILYEIRWLVKSIALKPKFHGDWCKNSHATRKKSENTLKSQQGVDKIFCLFSLSGLLISVLRVPEEKLAVHNFLGWALSGGGVLGNVIDFIWSLPLCFLNIDQPLKK